MRSLRCTKDLSVRVFLFIPPLTFFFIRHRGHRVGGLSRSFAVMRGVSAHIRAMLLFIPDAKQATSAGQENAWDGRGERMGW